jgi:hypothetical protein
VTMSDEQREEARKEFELSMLFNPYDLACEGCLVKDADGLYANPYIEAAWRGYQMCVQHAYNMLERFDPMRYIGPGLEGAFREASDFEHAEGAGVDPLYIQDIIRSSLTACKGTPA